VYIVDTTTDTGTIPPAILIEAGNE